MKYGERPECDFSTHYLETDLFGEVVDTSMLHRDIEALKADCWARILGKVSHEYHIEEVREAVLELLRLESKK